jgi:hypothetical protein
MELELAKLLVQDILDMNGGVLTYSPRIEVTADGVDISVRIEDPVSKDWGWAQGEEIIASVHSTSEKILARREAYRERRIAELENELSCLK